MGQYEDTLKEIETTIGSLPDFMKALAEDVLIQEWQIRLRRIQHTGEISRTDRISYRFKHPMSILYNVPHSSRKATRC
jgi:hypothetical protein